MVYFQLSKIQFGSSSKKGTQKKTREKLSYYSMKSFKKIITKETKSYLDFTLDGDFCWNPSSIENPGLP